MTSNNQARMRALLDQQAQQSREQQHSRQANALARDRWWGSRRSSKMRSKRRRCA